ncbi:restriction endonuclease subunit S [Agrobacterium pusense]|uniref:restriction endonuclease subunit S n=1 Tax=Agrobacterium pusense TaxID=648995 RepID=UPI001C6E9347|nr:restriction endonuclease subunit S [Agrobacterium pusense]MBW9070625.1 restriction endonuclease subunit S [Agrobacterium pusense]MBW9085728.1 restriction endonuclease subunit S [Agrobacterium pusense]MBW9127249.1 restriction endonuclease subunit S [Agrobacterium pusense]MBW9138296.1 restriction endonuclease subunit S [Agrobacterium pusense]
MTKFVLLQDLLEYTRDGEWGKGEAGDGLVEMAVIRGTDFAAVRFNDFSSVPTRYIPASVAARKKLQPGDILLETAGGTKDQPTGRTVFLSDRHFSQKNVPLTCASFSRFLRVKGDLVNPRYFFWYLQSIYESREMLPYHIQHTGVARFQYTDFASQWRVPIPNLSYQSAIADVLGSLDDKIELNRRMNETLEAMAQAIFRDWFVDFGPTRRKLEGATDPLTIMGGLVKDAERAQALADLFPAAFGDDGLPAGWKTVELAESFDSVMGQSPPGTSYNESGNGLPFFQGRRDFGFRFPQRRVYCTAPGRIAEENWTLISVRAPVGDVNRTKERCCIGRGVGAIIHKQKLTSLTYYTILELKPLLARFDGDGTVFGSINQKQVRSLPVIFASFEIMREFETLVSPMDELIRTRSEEIETLAATRDLLLPKLMSGEIRLSEAEYLMEAAQ